MITLATRTSWALHPLYFGGCWVEKSIYTVKGATRQPDQLIRFRENEFEHVVFIFTVSNLNQLKYKVDNTYIRIVMLVKSSPKYYFRLFGYSPLDPHFR